MTTGLTGPMVIATLGLIKNSGLAINGQLQQAIDTFITTGISGSVQKIVATAKPDVIQTLQTAPVCFTGFLPEGMPELEGIAKTSIPTSILDQATSIFKGPYGGSSVAAFIHIFTLANGYCTQVNSIRQAAILAQGKSFKEFGAQFDNYSDIISGGITSQFKALALPALAAELPNLGKMFNTKVLSDIFNPGTLVTHLYNLGLGDTGNLRKLVDENEISLDFLDSNEKSLLIEILKTVTGNDLKTIIDATSFNPYWVNDIRSLADVLDINKLFSDSALAAIGSLPTADKLANKLSNIGGQFSSMEEIASFLSGVNVTPFPLLSSLKSLVPDDFIDDLRNSTVKGTGPNEVLLITDLIGSVSGSRYIDKITLINRVQQQLCNVDLDVQAFKHYLDTSVPDLINATHLQTLIDNINNKATLIDVINNSNQQLINCASQLINEKTNLELANIVSGNAEASLQDMQNFISTLNKLPIQDDLLIKDFLLNVATDDIYGDAIKATIIEGQNLTRMSTYGINTGTRLS